MAKLSDEQQKFRRHLCEVFLAECQASPLCLHYQRELDALDTIDDLKSELAEANAAFGRAYEKMTVLENQLADRGRPSGRGEAINKRGGGPI